MFSKLKFLPTLQSFIFYQSHFQFFSLEHPKLQRSSHLHNQLPNYYHIVTFPSPSGNFENIAKIEISPHPAVLHFSPKSLSILFSKTPKTEKNSTAPQSGSKALSHSYIPTTLSKLWKFFQNWNLSPPCGHSFFTKITFQYFSLKHPKTPKIFIAPPLERKVLSHSDIPTTFTQLWKYSQNWSFFRSRGHSFFTKIPSEYFSLKHPKTP